MPIFTKLKKLTYDHIIILLLALILISALFLYVLQSKNRDLTIEAPTHHFYFIAQNAVDPFWTQMEEGILQAAEDLNVYIEFVSPRFTNNEEQFKYMDIAVISRVDGIITHVPSNLDYTEIIDRAYDRNIPVITIESDSSESKRAAYVGTNSYSFGKEAAKLMIKATGGKSKIAIISNEELSLGSVEYNLKMSGFISTLKEHPDMEIVKTYTSKLGIISAEEIAQDIISNYPEIDGIFTLGASDTLGCARLIVDRNRVGKIKLIGSGSSEEIYNYIDKEIIYGSIESDPYSMGYISVQTMVDLINDENIPTYINTQINVITKENLPVLPTEESEGDLP